MKNNKGFTLVETMIAAGLMAAVALIVNEFILKGRKQYSDFEGKMLVTTDVNQAFHNISIDLANLSRLTDQGTEVESFKGTDKAYLGIYGLAAADAAKYPACAFEDVVGRKGYSIIRYTTINQLRPAKLMKFWKENTSPLEPVFLDRSETVNNQIFNELINGNETQIKEIVILDGDGFTSSRLLVTNAEYVETFTDPYDNVDKSPTRFKYYKLTVRKPGTFYSPTSQAPLAHQFITGSYVVAVATKLLCVSQDKTQLLSIDELSGTTRVLLNVKAEKSTIASFRVNYLSSSNMEASPLGVSTFPAIEGPTPILTRRCIDQLLLSMDLSRGQKVMSYAQNIFVSNYNSKRPSSCR
ncbi:prepilin-type N-terminal cleavage/methylation domain-containing protein [Peredibacter sp. HCB2-198]|uniref:prepilin-type N-terminal cleavage/methylation domain-containing protein n=1 Tax=Peredibacter sp. HCB2-198 TaxID=3383025 RepID=UPI0038B61FCE